MNIYICSTRDGNLDEGMKNFAYNISNKLSKYNKVYHVNVRNSIVTLEFWRTLKAFKPDIIHIFLRPSLFTLCLGKIFKLYCGNSKIIFSALQPPILYPYTSILMKLCRPDLVLVQSANTGAILSSLGYKIEISYSGVDTSKFVPVDLVSKNKLRDKYNIDKEKYVLLHVGHINKGRNLEIFKSLLENDLNREVLIIGSINNFNFDEEVCNNLSECGCRVWRTYFTNLEEIYQLSDCYIFPTIDESYAIEMPLSVMEAMACNLPVITTRFGSLNKLFQEGNGLMFVDNVNRIEDKLRSLKKNNYVNTRTQVLDHSWEKLSFSLNEIYNNTLGGN